MGKQEQLPMVKRETQSAPESIDLARQGCDLLRLVLKSIPTQEATATTAMRFFFGSKILRMAEAIVRASGDEEVLLAEITTRSLIEYCLVWRYVETSPIKVKKHTQFTIEKIAERFFLSQGYDVHHLVEATGAHGELAGLEFVDFARERADAMRSAAAEHAAVDPEELGNWAPHRNLKSRVEHLLKEPTDQDDASFYWLLYVAWLGITKRTHPSPFMWDDYVEVIESERDEIRPRLAESKTAAQRRQKILVNVGVVCFITAKGLNGLFDVGAGPQIRELDALYGAWLRAAREPVASR